MIKPDGVQRNVVGNIIGRFEAKGFQLKVSSWTAPVFKNLVTSLSVAAASTQQRELLNEAKN
jgi:nucleoside diphosphate kinase